MSSEAPLICRFTWTADEAWTAARYHWRTVVRRPVRWLGYAVVWGILAISLWSLLSVGLSLPAVAFGVVSSYWLFLRRLEARWWNRQRFAKRPDANTVVEWRASDSGLQVSVPGLAESEIAWAVVVKCARTPEGHLPYSHESVYHWMPDHGFQSPGDATAFAELARRKVARYLEVR